MFPFSSFSVAVYPGAFKPLAATRVARFAIAVVAAPSLLLNYKVRLARFAGMIAAVALAASPIVLTAAPKEAALPAGVAENWWSKAQKNIQSSEYHASQQPEGLQAPNRAHDLRTWFDAEGAVSVKRDAISKGASPWRWGLALKQWGWADGAMTAAEPVDPVAKENTVTYERNGGLTEWYVNDAKGLRSWFKVANAPVGEGATLRLELSVRGDTRASSGADGNSIEFLSPGGVRIINYAGLKAWDALGRELACQLGLEGEGASQRVALEVNTSGAQFPITIDPLATGAAWNGESDQAGANFGVSVASAGDVNGDDYSDIVVGAYQYDNGQTDEGRAYVYLGSASGLATNAAWTAESDQDSAYFGGSVASAGDVNGDGYSDVLIGAYSYSYDNGQTHKGRAYVYLGSASGLAANAAWTAEGDQASAFFGNSVASAGDVNGDGYSDVLIGAWLYDNGQTNEGRAYVYLGSASGLAAGAAWTAESDQTNACFGYSVASAGDVNGDGYSDIAVGAYQYDNGQTDEGRAFLYLGSASGLAANAAWTAESDQGNARFGASVASAGDVNGDGYSDVVVGAYQYDNGQTDEGRAYLYLGSASGLAANAAWTAESDQISASFGFSVATAGDVNGDGYSDVLVGAYLYGSGGTEEGRAYMYMGSASGLAASHAWTAESEQAFALFGYSVASAGDVNGDGYSDVVAGAFFYDNGQTDEGRAYVYLGSASGLAASHAWTAESDQFGSLFGCSVASAGDVNGDGYSDVVIGAYQYDNGQTDEGRAYVYLGSAAGLTANAAWIAESNQVNALFGYTVASAGDVNGDGYSDVVIGAYQYDNGQTDEGRAYVYLGSASGPASSAAWTAESDQENAWFGYIVASAGDVNGDGYSDVVIGAYQYDNGQTDEGRAYVYLGSASGPAASAAWTAESDQENAYFGYSVASAGDVNGDGYSDIVVGAILYENDQYNEGLAFVYLGSALGLAASSAWTGESDQGASHFGYSVASAGDVNGDGYSDVIVGAIGYDIGQHEEGRAFVYLGSASGLATSTAWTAEGDQAAGWFGASVASAGDVNGDGYSDVIVGASTYDNGQLDEGRAYVYLGSASGLATSTAWIAEGDQMNNNFGARVASAGDVNGDGYSDVIVGAYFYNGVGRAYVYYGNGEPGLGLAPRQRRGDNSAPLSIGGVSNNPVGIRLAALGRTPYGRGKVKLQWEVKPAGTAFDGTSLGESSSWIDTGTAGAGLNELAGTETASSRYHWRVRLLYNKATATPQQASRWLTFDGKATDRTTFRTGQQESMVTDWQLY